MDLRKLRNDLSASERIEERRKLIESEFDIDLSGVRAFPESIGQADEKNCEQMFGMIPVPVGYAGPLRIQFSSKELVDVHLPLATTEGALVASVNRGCKALAGTSVRTSSVHHGISRSIAWEAKRGAKDISDEIRLREAEWKEVAEETSDHLKILGFDLEVQNGFIFLTIRADTDEAMGMNMITIAAQAIGDWVSTQMPDAKLVTVAANIDSDKKPSLRTYENGRGYEVFVEADIHEKTIRDILKSDPDAMYRVAKAKLETGSELAGAIGSNLHAANMIAALYLATGQDIAHTVEGSLCDTSVEQTESGLRMIVRLPALLIGIRGGGTALPAQSQCLHLLLKHKTKLHPCAQLAETIGGAVLAGELSLLAAQAAQHLAKAHAKMGR